MKIDDILNSAASFSAQNLDISAKRFRAFNKMSEISASENVLLVRFNNGSQ